MTTIRERLAKRADELLQAAFDGVMSVLQNPEAPATSTASATGNAIRLYEILASGDLDDKDISEMTLEELDRKRRALERDLEERPKLRLEEFGEIDE